MSERPILFSAPMVRALLNGIKTQTRRVTEREFAIGDRLWVREQWRTESAAYDDLAPSDMDADYTVIYEADGQWKLNKTVGRLRQSIHMPRWASRLTLVVNNIRVEHLQDISHDDAVAEGVGIYPASMSAQKRYREIWEGISGAGSWEKNPLVIALTFTVTPSAIGEG